MQLDNRKMKILELIIDMYIKFGTPISSKTISNLLEDSISSATVRNEMSILYELGFLEQPHTSSGRVPSQLGYRLYIDKIMKKKSLSEQQINEISSLFNVKNPDYSDLIENAGKLLSQITRCMTVLSSMVCEELIITKVEVVEVANRTLAIIILTSSGIIKSKVCKVDFDLNKNTIEFIYRFVNNVFAGKSVEEISRNYINSLVSNLDGYTIFFTPILYNVFEMCEELHISSFYIDGQTNLLLYKELKEMAVDIIRVLNNNSVITNIINECVENLVEPKKAKVKFGRELKNEELAKTGVIICKYDIGNIGIGNILIVGPDRLDYSLLVPWVEYFAKLLSLALSEALEII